MRSLPGDSGLCLFCNFQKASLRSLGNIQYRHNRHTKRPFTNFQSLKSTNAYRGSTVRNRENAFGSGRSSQTEFDWRRVAAKPRRYDEKGQFTINRDQRVLQGLKAVRGPRRPSRGDREDYWRSMLPERFKYVKEQLKSSPMLTSLGLDHASFQQPFKEFEDLIVSNNTRADGDKGSNYINLGVLRGLYEKEGNGAGDTALLHAFYGYVTGAKFSASDIQKHQDLTDLRYPSEWYPRTRKVLREIHLHVGPTNSGKTYQALKRLEEAESGLYAGPLRLLAYEVYARLNAKGKRCHLITGDDRRAPDDGSTTVEMCSSTVEMVPLHAKLDVAVIDEIQMIGSSDRGWAWTQALLGVNANEVHLCGEERVVALIQDLVAMMGDKLIVHRYERLSPLQMDSKSLNGQLERLRKGDCVVSFSIMGIHALKREIEKKTGRKVAIVYGSLPPETRSQQARLFNDPSNDYDFLVASDAVGMGLNLGIKRIIFESVYKRVGRAVVRLTAAEIKQIAGRAGRFRTAREDIEAPDPAPVPQEESSRVLEKGKAKSAEQRSVGLVTTLEPYDYSTVASLMSKHTEALSTAGLLVPGKILERVAAYFPPETPFSYILLRCHEMAKIQNRFHVCRLRDQIAIADAIHNVKGLSVSDRNTICAAPTSIRKEEAALVQALARCIEQRRGGNLLEIKEIPIELLDQDIHASREFLFQLEMLHKSLVLYNWLSYRFVGVFPDRLLANHVKGLVETAIAKTLDDFTFTKQARTAVRHEREQQLIQEMSKAGFDSQGEDIISLEGGSRRQEERAIHEEPYMDLTTSEDLEATDTSSVPL